jgi:hypothetical protein
MLTGLIAVMPATKSRPEKRGPVVVEGASPATAAKQPEQLGTPNGPVPDLIFDPPYVVLDATSFKNGLSESNCCTSKVPPGTQSARTPKDFGGPAGYALGPLSTIFCGRRRLRCRSMNTSHEAVWCILCHHVRGLDSKATVASTLSATTCRATGRHAMKLP